MILRARWHGPLPRPREFFMSSTRPRFAYRLMDVEALKDLPHHPTGKRLRLIVERVSSQDVPAGVVVHPWKWDARRKTVHGLPRSDS